MPVITNTRSDKQPTSYQIDSRSLEEIQPDSGIISLHIAEFTHYTELLTDDTFGTNIMVRPRSQVKTKTEC